jgi:hypothetical protein
MLPLLRPCLCAGSGSSADRHLRRDHESECLAYFDKIQGIRIKDLLVGIGAISLEVRSIATFCRLMKIIVVPKKLLKLVSGRQHPSRHSRRAFNSPSFVYLGPGWVRRRIRLRRPWPLADILESLVCSQARTRGSVPLSPPWRYDQLGVYISRVVGSVVLNNPINPWDDKATCGNIGRQEDP